MGGSRRRRRLLGQEPEGDEDELEGAPCTSNHQRQRQNRRVVTRWQPEGTRVEDVLREETDGVERDVRELLD